MKIRLLLLFISGIIANLLSAQYKVEGGVGEPYAYTENLSGTGIEKVYLLNTLSGASISYTSSTTVKFYKYKQSLADKKDVPINTPPPGSNTYTISNLEDGYGYLVSEGESVKAAVWIIDYNAHLPVLSSIDVIEGEDKCDYLKLYVTKLEDELFFYTNSGARKTIPREYSISYVNKEWNDANEKFEEKEIVLSDLQIGTDINIDAPLMDTHFTLKGDQFAKHFNITKEISSTQYTAVAVEAHIISEQEERDANNESGNESGRLGGSAPVVINFYGHGNEPVAGYYTWLIYNRQDMNSPIARYTDKKIKYTFEEWGDYVVKLEVADKSSVCVDTTSVTFSVSESWIDAPNFFSPGDSPGVNDEFKVAYKSIVKFKCTIFNRWGTKLYQWTDPSKGWDGRYKGSYVTTGVYFCVIEAEGSDGKKYKIGRDINVFRSK